MALSKPLWEISDSPFVLSHHNIVIGNFQLPRLTSVQIRVGYFREQGEIVMPDDRYLDFLDWLVIAVFAVVAALCICGDGPELMVFVQ